MNHIIFLRHFALVDAMELYSRNMSMFLLIKDYWNTISIRFREEHVTYLGRFVKSMLCQLLPVYIEMHTHTHTYCAN